MLVYLTLVFMLVPAAFGRSGAEDKPIEVSREHMPDAQCVFSVHERSADGPEVAGTSLHQELFYKIHCKQEPGYCLFVSNCTVSAGSEPPYEIIDRQGCTTEPSLFEHVRYLDDFTGGIFNPLPVRFRNQQSAVRFQCATKLQLREQGGHCERPACTHNDYSPDANFHVHDH